jgi:hypothetical protein
MNEAAMLADIEWLTSPAAEPWLAEAAAAGPAPSVQLAARLRRDLSAARVHLVLEQAELRRRAKAKFADAERMFFTRKGLEQASGKTVAAYKAGRFAAGSRLADLCCGIGGDLLAFARRGPATGVERDPLTAAFAQANLRACRLASESHAVVAADAESFDLAPFAAWHIDPDRRPAGRRTSQPDLHEPPLEAIEQMLAAHPAASIKLAPAAVVPDQWHEQMELEWIGWRGECKQQVAWSGPLARYPGRRVATVLIRQGDRSIAHSLVEDPDAWLPIAPNVGAYLYEAHAAVLAADLRHSLGARHRLIDINQLGYYTADHLVHDPLLAAFEVLDHFPADRKQIAAYCREHRIGRLEIKVRGLDWNPAQVRAELKLPAGENEATLLVWRCDRTGLAAFARRVAASHLEQEEREGTET